MSAKARSPVAFGPYVITRRIARGGMAEIYRARTRKGDSRWVAIKMMRPSLGHEELRERLFQREARIAGKMQHEAIVPVFEFGNEMDRPYISMEYIRGRDLSHLLKNEKKGRELIDYRLGLYIGLKAAGGLGHAHRLLDEETGKSLGIVHRDISPGNVMIGYDGAVKVLDFGVARMNETQGVHTQTGTLRGKFAYMSPEQTLGEDLDARSDVFSLGTVLYELLTGTNCFRAQNPIATLERVQGLRPVPPSRANREIPKTVDRILARCLAKDKKRRFKDCRALEDAIGDFLHKQGFDGRAALVTHMEGEFSWEKHEEEQELTREEEEVALFDVVDFALLADVGGLDARNVKVSQEEEASQAEVKRHAIKREEADQEVFDEEVHDQPTSRIPTGMERPPAGAQPIELLDEDEKTVAQPPLFRQTSEQVLAGEVQVSSLLEAPTADEPAVTDDQASNPLMTRAGVPEIRYRTDPGTAPATLMSASRAPVYRRPLPMMGAIGALVLLVAVGVTIGAQNAEEPVYEAVEKEPTTTLEPVRISLDDEQQPEPKPRQKKGHKRLRLPGSAQARVPDPSPTPVSVKPPPAEEKAEPRRVEPQRAETKRRIERKREDAPRRRAPVRKKRIARRAKKAAASGFLNVGARPWAHITIDGKKWPYQTPQAGIELPAGRHVVTLTNDNTGVTKTVNVVIKPNAYRTIMLDMRKK